MNKIADFVEYISSVKTSSKVLNQYSSIDNPSGSEVARHNLRVYLGDIFRSRTEYLFLGEAPGYKGCLLTGVPFTSEAVLIRDDIPFLLKGSYKIRPFSKKFQKERTSTVIWNTFRDFQFYPLLWNSLPFYPHDDETKEYNRKPSSKEIISYGHEPFQRLIDIFQISKIVAIGRVAEAC